MKKFKYLLLFLIVPLFSLLLFACGKSQNLKEEKLDKTNLLAKINEVKRARNPLIAYDNNTKRFAGYYYIKKEKYIELNIKIDEAVKAYKNQKLTHSELISNIDTLNKAKAEIESIKPHKREIIQLDKVSTLIASLYSFSHKSYPREYQDFYSEYVRQKAEILKESTTFEEDFKIIQKQVKDLDDYIREEIMGTAKFNKEFDFCKMRNPFKSCHPRFENLPVDGEVFISEKGVSRDLIREKGIRAFDASGKDISSRIYFKQTTDFINTSRQYVQIACSDDYLNESISNEVYLLINRGTKLDIRKPKLIVPTAIDIASSAAISIKNIKDYVIATDYLGVRIKNEQINFKAYYKNGLECDNFTEVGKKEPGFYTVKYQAHDSDLNYSDVKEKEFIILPPSEKFKSEKENIKSDVVPKDLGMSISDLEKLSKLSDEDLKYKYISKEPLAERDYSKVNNNPNAGKRKVMLYDEIKQYIDMVYKQDGFHQMNYNLMQYIDSVVVGNKLGDVAIPSKDIIDMFHKNGVKVYGSVTIDFEALGGSKSTLEDLIQNKIEGNERIFKYLQLLSEIPKRLGFDGWFVSIKTGFYKGYLDDSSLSMAERLEHKNNVAKFTKKTAEELIPFLRKLKENLNNNNQKLLLSEGISDNGSVTVTSAYDSIHKEMAKSCDIFITSHFGIGVKDLTIKDEIAKYKNDTGKDEDTFYKSLFAGYNKNDSVTLNNYLDLLTEDTPGVRRLATNLFLVNLSNRLFNLRDNGFNYDKLDPKSPTNLYGSNDYYSYIERLQKFVDANSWNNQRTNELKAHLASLSQDEAKDFDRSAYFNLAEHIIAKTPVVGDDFYTNFNLNNGKKYFKDGEVIKNFKDEKTYFEGGGYNNFSNQAILPFWNCYDNNGLKYNLSYDFENVLNGLSSLNIKGENKTSTSSEIDLFASSMNLKDLASEKYIYKISYKSNLNLAGLKLRLKVYTEDGATYQSDSAEVLDNNKNDLTFEIPKAAGKITKISLVVEAPIRQGYDLNLYSLFIGKESLLGNKNAEIKNLIIDKVGYNDNIDAEALLSYDALENASYYVMYQVTKDGKLIYLGMSKTNHMIAKGITRFAKNPVNPKFPTLDEYDKTYKLKLVAYDKFDNIISSDKIIESNWPGKLVEGGKAEVKLSSKIAKVNESIIFTPVLDKNVESYEFNFYNKPGEKNYGIIDVQKIEGSNSYVVRFNKEGFYGFSYKCKNPYGEDSFTVEKGVIISNNVEAESDITSDAKIDDSEEFEGINYSPGIPNSSEKPSYLIDTDANGNPNLATKWCNTSKGPGQRWVIVEFAAEVSVSRFELSHCTTSLSHSWDRSNRGAITSEYEIYTSNDKVNWTKVVHRENNIKDVTVDKLDEPVTCKYIKLNVVNGGQDITARIYDLRIFGSR